MADSCGSASSWQNEVLEGWQLGIDGIDGLFDGFNHGRGDDVAWPDVALGGVGGEVASEDEELVLHVGEELDVGVEGAVGDEQSDLGAEFIDCAVGFESCAGLADSLSSYEGCLALVACTGVYFHELRVDS